MDERLVQRRFSMRIDPHTLSALVPHWRSGQFSMSRAHVAIARVNGNPSIDTG
jgi:hypothetical protein